MLLRPANDRVLVKKDDPEKTTKGGIIIPEISENKATTGVVLAVGPGKYSTKTAQLIPMASKVGDKVVFHPYAGSELRVGGEIIHCMTDADVWCVIENDSE